MNTTVFNLRNLAVTEYTAPVAGLSERFEADSNGLYKVEGATDAGAAITAAIEFGMPLVSGAVRQRPRLLYLFGEGLDDAEASIKDSTGEVYSYSPRIQNDGVWRFALGRGVRDNYLQLALSIPASGVFEIDQLDLVTDESRTRRL